MALKITLSEIERLVPVGDRPLNALWEATDRLPTLHSVLDELIGLRANYGSAFLRVGAPIIRHIRPVLGAIDVDPDAVSPAGRFAQRAAGTAGAIVKSARPATPPLLDWTGQVQVQVDSDSADGLHEGLTRAFHVVVTLMEEQMREEASRLTQVLAAAMDQFFDRFARTPDVQEEWAALCAPVRAELWPETFGPGAANLAAGLGQLGDAVPRVGAAALEIRAAAVGMGLSNTRG